MGSRNTMSRFERKAYEMKSRLKKRFTVSWRRPPTFIQYVCRNSLGSSVVSSCLTSQLYTGGIAQVTDGPVLDDKALDGLERMKARQAAVAAEPGTKHNGQEAEAWLANAKQQGTRGIMFLSFEFFSDFCSLPFVADEVGLEALSG